MTRQACRSASMLCAIALVAWSVQAQEVTRESVPGITNLARLETTVACAGAVDAAAVPEIKKLGFASIINLRLATEPGAEVESEAAAAKAAGLKYFHLPYDGSPNPEAADQFLAVMSEAGTQPAFIHCVGGNRAATMWLIKRLAVDHWDLDRAASEAEALGQSNPAMRQFAIDYAQSHRR